MTDLMFVKTSDTWLGRKITLAVHYGKKKNPEMISIRIHKQWPFSPKVSTANKLPEEFNYSVLLLSQSSDKPGYHDGGHFQTTDMDLPWRSITSERFF